MTKDNIEGLEGFVVAIDGPAGVGKSSIASMVAARLGFYFLNSGNFYPYNFEGHFPRSSSVSK